MYHHVQMEGLMQKRKEDHAPHFLVGNSGAMIEERYLDVQLKTVDDDQEVNQKRLRCRR